MATSKVPTVPKRNITSVDVTGFSGGLYLLGDQNAEGNQFVASNNVELSQDGYIQNRKSFQKWLPNTVETCYEIFPAITADGLKFYVADEGKIKFCQQGDSSWTDCGGSNTVSTGTGIKNTFLRVLDSLLILNGVDKLAYVDLSNDEVVDYTFVADPTTALTAAATGITNSGAYKIYYGYTFSSATGETKISDKLTYTINKPRDSWKNDGTEYLTLTRPAGIPSGATYWNLYIALAANGGTIQDSDMLMLAGGLDLNTVSVVDNGTLSIDIGRGNPPTDNSTDGPICTYGIETNGRPVLFGDVGNPYNIWIGGDGEFARDFSSANGGYRTEPSKGTNYYPASVIGFRNGQGIPSLTVLFSNTQGLSKQATLEQQTINYGNQSFSVWGVTEQNYGAAGVASSYGVVNYNGALNFPSVDGFMSMDTQPQLQNVLSSKRISGDIDPYVKRIKVSSLNEIIGTGWDNKLFWLVPAYGFDTPTQILVRDLNNSGSWYTLDTVAQWIGTVSPPDSPAFLYVCQGNEILKLSESLGTVDFKTTGTETFSTSATGALLGINEAHNAYQALVQAVFYIRNLVGPIVVGVKYRNGSGRIKTKQKLYNGPAYTASSSGGWSDPHYVFSGFPLLPGWDEIAPIEETASAIEKETKRIPVPISDLASEVQWFFYTPKGYSAFQLRVVSYEGENLGVKPDLR